MGGGRRRRLRKEKEEWRRENMKRGEDFILRCRNSRKMEENSEKREDKKEE